MAGFVINGSLRSAIRQFGKADVTGVCQRGRSRKRASRSVLALLTFLLPSMLIESSSIAGVATSRLPVRDFVVSGLEKTLVVSGPRTIFLWPRAGQSAVAVRGVGLIGSTPDEHPVPIASLTKIMTTVVLLHDHPLLLRQSGPTILISASDVADYSYEANSGDSTVRVVVGERLTEYQLLEALLVRSGDNIADLLAIWDAGSVAKFVVKMNAMAHALGFTSTHYSDASGLSPASVSTASDQAKIAAVLMGSEVVRSIVRRPRVTLPVVGSVSSYNPALGIEGIIGVKSGWTPEAKSCLVIAAWRRVDRRGVLVISVALGQPGGLVTPARVDETLLTVATKALFGFRIVDPGTTVPLAGSMPNLAILEPRAPHVAIVWHGLRLTQKIIHLRGISPSVIASEPAGSVVGQLQIRAPWGVIEMFSLTSMGAPNNIASPQSPQNKT